MLQQNLQQNIRPKFTPKVYNKIFTARRVSLRHPDMNNIIDNLRRSHEELAAAHPRIATNSRIPISVRRSSTRPNSETDYQLAAERAGLQRALQRRTNQRAIAASRYFTVFFSVHVF